MYSIQELQERIQKELAELSFNKQPIELYEPIKYSLSLGGKRIRPLLTLLACDLFGGDINKALKTSIGIEVFHNFTLLHDDIMDKAPLRRFINRNEFFQVFQLLFRKFAFNCCICNFINNFIFD